MNEKSQENNGQNTFQRNTQGILKEVTGQLKSKEKQKDKAEKCRKQPTAPTSAPQGEGNLKPQPQSKPSSPRDNRLVVLVAG
jgi:hypothetical protein